MISFMSRAFALCLIVYAMAGYSSAHATSALYKRECNGCHSGPPTCNGCHAHGVHAITGDIVALNLVATTDKPEYAAGDDIRVTLSGGNQPRAEDGWAGVKIFDDKGVELAHDKSELPATLTTRAYEGMSKLYVAWIGHEYDGAGAKYGTPIGTTFGAGMRESFLAGQHLQERHIEEIVASNEFSVLKTPTVDASSTTPDGNSAPAPISSAGGGSADPAWIFGAALITALRRYRRYRISVQ